jgi:hypothetical protein
MSPRERLAGRVGCCGMARDPIPSFELILEITTLEGTARSATIVASRRHWPTGRLTRRADSGLLTSSSGDLVVLTAV